MSLSNYAEAKTLNHIFCGAESSWSATNIYVGLATAVNTDASITEVANSYAYARVQISDTANSANNKFAPITIDGSENGSITTDAQVTFATANGGDWGTVTHIGIWDSGTHGAGNLIAWGALTVSKTITDGDTFVISAGNLTITLD